MITKQSFYCINRSFSSGSSDLWLRVDPVLGYCWVYDPTLATRWYDLVHADTVHRQMMEIDAYANISIMHGVITTETNPVDWDNSTSEIPLGG